MKCASCTNTTTHVDSDGNCIFCSSFSVITGKTMNIPFTYSNPTEKITVTSCGGDDCEVSSSSDQTLWEFTKENAKDATREYFAPLVNEESKMKCIRCNHLETLNKDRICHHCWDILLGERGVGPEPTLTDFPDSDRDPAIYQKLEDRERKLNEELTAKVAPTSHNYTYHQRILIRLLAVSGFYLSIMIAIDSNSDSRGWVEVVGLIVAIMSGIMWEIGRDTKGD